MTLWPFWLCPPAPGTPDGTAPACRSAAEAATPASNSLVRSPIEFGCIFRRDLTCRRSPKWCFVGLLWRICRLPSRFCLFIVLPPKAVLGMLCLSCVVLQSLKQNKYLQFFYCLPCVIDFFVGFPLNCFDVLSWSSIQSLVSCFIFRPIFI
jgi:hypothetical protein